MKRFATIAVLAGSAVWLAPAASAVMISQVSAGADQEVAESGGLIATGRDNDNENRVGALGGGFTQGAAFVFMFDISAAPVTDVFTSANLRLFLDGKSSSPNFNADLYGVGFGATANDFPFPGSNNLYFEGAFGADPNTGASAIADDVFIPSTANDTEANISNAALLAFLNSRPLDGSGNFAFFRLNPDANSGASARGFNIATGDGPGNQAPLLTAETGVIPEPASLALLGLGVALMLGRRRV